MAKRRGEVKKKERYRLWMKNPESREKLETVSLSQDGARDAIAEEQARTGILGGKFRETFPGGGQVAKTFKAEITAIGVFDDDIVAKVE